jgi:hypothetical protein
MTEKVNSVNGETGDVVLDANNVGAIGINDPIAKSQVTGLDQDLTNLDTRVTALENAPGAILHCFQYTGTIPAGSGSSDPAYHAFDCPSGYVLVSAVGLLQTGGEQGTTWSPVSYTPGVAPDNPISVTANSAIFPWVNLESEDKPYSVFLICLQVS